MSKASSSLLHVIRTMAGAYKEDSRSDAELLSRYVATHDEVAFASLMVRHGPLVWGICSRILGNPEDVEDAYQVVLLALARKAEKIRVKDTLAGWLHEVARQTALDARKAAQSRTRLKERLKTMASSEAAKAEAPTEAYELLHDELAKLPERLRVPLVLHFLEGKSAAETAQILGVVESAVWKRLARGRSLLQKRLSRRGLVLGAGALGTLLAGAVAQAMMPATLMQKTVQAAAAFREGTLAGGLANFAKHEMMRASLATPWWMKGWVIAVLCVGGLGVGGGAVAWRAGFFGTKAGGPPSTPKKEVLPRAEGKKANPVRQDVFGDPLPKGALARIGTIRFRHNWGLEGAFLPNGKTIVTPEGNEGVRFWETATGKELRRLPGPEMSRRVAVSSNGKKLAVAGNNEVWVWDLAANPFRKLWQQQITFGAGAVAFAPGDKTLAAACQGPLWLFDADKGQIRQKMGGFGPCWSNRNMVFSPDGKTLATSAGLWDTTTWKKRRGLQRPDKRGVLRPVDIHSAAFSPDGRMLAATTDADDEHRVRILSLWDLRTGIESPPVARVIGGALLAFLPDGRTLLEAACGRIHFWDVITGKASLPSVETSGRFTTQGETGVSPDGKLLVRWQGPAIWTWNTATGQEVGPVGAIHDAVRELKFTPDGKMLATVGGENELQLWEVETGRPGRQLEKCNDGKAFDMPSSSPFIDYSSDGRRVGAIRYNNRLVGDLRMDRYVTWDMRSGRASKGQPPPLNTNHQCVASSNGRWQLWASKERLILLDRSTGKEIRHFPGVRPGGFLAVSDDGRTVLQRDEKEAVPDVREIKIWSVKTGQALMTLEVKGSRRHGPLALSPDGRFVAESTESAIWLWEAASAREGRSLETSETELQRIAWSLNGRLLAGGDEQGGVWVWDVFSGQLLQRFTGHRDKITALAFSPDGLRLASGSKDATALVWDLFGSPQQSSMAAQRLSTDELWAVLRKADAAGAWQAVAILAQRPEEALPLLRQRLWPPPAPDSGRVATLLAELGDDNFQVRRRAEKQLAEMGERIEPALREALVKKPSIEVCQRIKNLLEKGAAGLSGLSVKQLQACRAVDVLERIGTPEARLLLEELAKRGIGVQATEARAALQRLANREGAKSAP